MKQKVFSKRIEGKRDMAELESTVGSLLGGEDNKCSLVRSSDFVRLRLRALYGRGKAQHLHVYGGGLQISLDPDNIASVYLLSVSVDDEDVVLGKRAEPESPGRGDELDDDLEEPERDEEPLAPSDP